MIAIAVGAIAMGASAYLASLAGVPIIGQLAIGLVVQAVCMWWEVIE